MKFIFWVESKRSRAPAQYIKCRYVAAENESICINCDSGKKQERAVYLKLSHSQQMVGVVFCDLL